MKNTKLLIPAVLLLLGFGTGFGGGYFFRNYQLSKTKALFTGPGNGNYQRFVGGRNGGGMTAGVRGGMVSGSILSMDDKSVTVKLADGSTKIVFFGNTTTYSDTKSAVQGDLKVGSNIAVFGTSNSDGSVTAANIQINPEFGRVQTQTSTPSAQ